MARNRRPKGCPVLNQPDRYLFVLRKYSVPCAVLCGIRPFNVPVTG